MFRRAHVDVCMFICIFFQSAENSIHIYSHGGQETTIMRSALRDRSLKSQNIAFFCVIQEMLRMHKKLNITLSHQ